VKRRVRPADEAPGQDSFLDIVANLVGILIILVMIVGARAKDAMVQAERELDPPEIVDVEIAKNAFVAVRHDLENLIGRIQRQDIEIAYRRLERDRALEIITAAERELERRRGELSDQQREAHDLQVRLAAAERELLDLKRSREAVELATPGVTVIEHRPTPLAKTVFGQEVHFQLKAGRVALVPIDELVERFKAEAKEKAWKLRDAPQITETVGPVRGFRLRYTLKRVAQQIETRAGVVSQQRVELDHFVLVPVRDDLGEPLETALQPGSELRSVLAAYDPHQATVTVWVYPDSFDLFRQLKESLFQTGFLTASRPLPQGEPISGSPQGTRSAVQ
jgi:hypothetical protein